MEGNQPYWPENLVRRHVRPAAVQAGIAKTIGWHFQTLVRNATQVNGEDIKVVQESFTPCQPSGYTRCLHSSGYAHQACSSKKGLGTIGNV